jgi:hypothetical protein
MEVLVRVFDNPQKAKHAVSELSKLGLSERRLALLIPGERTKTKAPIPVTDTERPGMGTAMGAAVGGAMGAAGGATLGLAAATLLVPGVGPVMAFGLLGAALLGGTGAIAGAAVGSSLEEELGEGFPHEDVYLYEHALRHGRSVVVAYADEGDQADAAREILEVDSVSLDSLRDEWWDHLRDGERSNYQSTGRDFNADELSYRQGYQAALHPKRRGQSFSDVRSDLCRVYDESELNPAFECGYDRGVPRQTTLKESDKG